MGDLKFLVSTDYDTATVAPCIEALLRGGVSVASATVVALLIADRQPEEAVRLLRADIDGFPAKASAPDVGAEHGADAREDVAG